MERSAEEVGSRRQDQYMRMHILSMCCANRGTIVICSWWRL